MCVSTNEASFQSTRQTGHRVRLSVCVTLSSNFRLCFSSSNAQLDQTEENNSMTNIEKTTTHQPNGLCTKHRKKRRTTFQSFASIYLYKSTCVCVCVSLRGNIHRHKYAKDMEERNLKLMMIITRKWIVVFSYAEKTLAEFTHLHTNSRFSCSGNTAH